MHALVRLLLLERWRKLDQHYGWAAYASSSVVIGLLFWATAASAARWMQAASVERLEVAALGLWTGWVITAVVTGKDLSWQIPLERLRIFPSPGFCRIYALTFALGFLSFPILVGMVVMQYWTGIRLGLDFPGSMATGAGYLLFVASARLSASLGRNYFFFARFLASPRKKLAASAIIVCSAMTAIAMKFPGVEVPHPAKLFGLLLAGTNPVRSLLWMGLWTAIVAAIDATIRYDLHYSGMPGSLAGGSHKMFNALMELPSPWPGPIFRIGILGWLRSRGPVLLFLWGSLYSFAWTCYSRPQGSLYFYLFILMNLLFHSHLRGNLLGTDRGGAWIYYNFPGPVERALSSKSHSLSLLQACMIASLLIAGFLWAETRFTVADWSGFLSYASSGILFSEICGFYFSIRFPQSIDRTSQFSGSSSAGAISVGALQFLYLIIFLLASAYMRRHLAPAGLYGLWVILPLGLGILRHLVLKFWIQQMMLNESEVLLNKLQWD